MEQIQQQVTEEQKAEMIDILGQVRGYAGKLAQGCGLIRDNFQDGEMALGQKRLAELLEGIGWVAEAFAASQAVLAENGVELELGKLAGALRPAMEGLESQDFGLIGDVLEYELRPILESWHEELEKIPAEPTA